jgi:hypothetical protein
MVVKYLHISHRPTYIQQMENDDKFLTIFQLLEDSGCKNLNISNFKLHGHILDP